MRSALTAVVSSCGHSRNYLIAPYIAVIQKVKFCFVVNWMKNGVIFSVTVDRAHLGIIGTLFFVFGVSLDDNISENNPDDLIMSDLKGESGMNSESYPLCH